MQKVKTYTKFKINEKAYRWRDDHGYWYIHCPSVMQMGFHEVRRSESDLLEQQYQELIAHVPDETLAEASRTDQDKQSTTNVFGVGIPVYDSPQSFVDSQKNQDKTVHVTRHRNGNQSKSLHVRFTEGDKLFVAPAGSDVLPDDEIMWDGPNAPISVVTNIIQQTNGHLVVEFKDETASDVYLNTPWIHPVNETKESEIPVPLKVINTTAPSGPSHSWVKKEESTRPPEDETTRNGDWVMSKEEYMGKLRRNLIEFITGPDNEQILVYRGCRVVVEEEPTRPSEDDMINKPSVNTDPGRAYTEGAGYEQGRVVKRRHEIGNIAVEETFEKTYDQHPQFRDIGIRIDRYGKLVFKPELSNEED